ncbi:mechanosensitive ion channel family protein, partial [Thiolapillus sp.]
MAVEAAKQAASAAPVDVVEEAGQILDPDNAMRLLELGKDFLIQYGPNVLAAIAVFLIGRILAKWMRRVVVRLMNRAKLDPMVTGFTASMVYIGLMVFVVMAALGQVGIQTTSFLAVLGAAGLAIGLALQGSLANFAAGFLLIVFRPFKVGDVIEAAGVTGKVDLIQIFTTTLRTPDNKTIIVPNAKLGNDNIINYSTQKTRRVDMVIGVSYDADIRQTRDILQDIIDSDKRILREPEPLIVVGELADSSVNFFVRVWVHAADYWGVYYDANENIKLRLDEAGIGIP